ncbi:class I SAM-dependent methyltransferase [Pannonibacter sp.]|uniref:class I SAM-dependent methyltransferase n=1 Tax=Pannonibacter sp. TaxID=1906786 RepID=UPI003F6EAA27
MIETADQFEGLAEFYEANRPGYPQDVFAHLAQTCPARQGLRVAVDVGAGPGNSTDNLLTGLGEGWSVIASEPGEDMRRVLMRRFRTTPQVQIIAAPAEQLALPSGFASLVVACSAVHWFDRPKFYAEAARILAPSGVLALVRNRRRPAQIFDDFEAYVTEHYPSRVELEARELRKEPSHTELSGLDGFLTAHSRRWPWSRAFTARELIDFYLTRATVWAVVRRLGLSRVMADYLEICARHGLSGEARMEVQFDTLVRWTQRRARAAKGG